MKSDRSRGRPRTFSDDEALERMTTLFHARGYDGVAVTDLVDALGCSAPTLYTRFGSKDEIFRRVVKRYAQTAYHSRSDDLTGCASPREAVHTLLKATARTVCRPGAPRGCLILNGSLTDHPDALKAVHEERAWILEQFTRLIASSGPEASLPASPEHVARYFFAVAQGLAGQAVDGATLEDLESVADLAMQVWPAPRGHA